MNLPVPPVNILTSRIPGGCEVSTIRYNTGRYETRAFLPTGGEIGPNGAIDFTLPDALRTHAEIIDNLCGSDHDARRNTTKVELTED